MRDLFAFILNLCLIFAVTAHERKRCECNGVRELIAVTEIDHIYSPTYNGYVCPNINCTWKIKADDPKSTIFLKFLWFSIEEPDEGRCKEESVTLRDGDYRYSPQIAQICGNPHPSPEINSTSDTMMMTFVSGKKCRSYGFKAQYQMIPPKAGSITSSGVVMACSGLGGGVIVIVVGIGILIYRKYLMRASSRNTRGHTFPESANIYAIDNKALKLDEMPEILMKPPSYDEVCGDGRPGAK